VHVHVQGRQGVGLGKGQSMKPGDRAGVLRVALVAAGVVGGLAIGGWDGAAFAGACIWVAMVGK
jgi:hypothetical protein